MASKRDIEFLASEGVTQVVSLVEEKELLTLVPPETSKDREKELKERGIGFLSYPIVDFGVPSVNLAKELVGELEVLVRYDHSVVMHCWAGLGRAGTMLACYLVKQGLTPREAMAEIRWMRPLAIQTEEQQQFIFDFDRR